MNINTVIQKYLTAVCFAIILVGLTIAAEQEKRPAIEFRSIKVTPRFNKMRASIVGEAIAFKDWPKTEVRHAAPEIKKSLLSNPELVTRESIAYTDVQFDKEPWGKGRWSWDCLVESDKRVPDKLPPELKEKVLAKIPAERKKDQAFVDRYLKRRLERYQKSLKYRLEGQMSLEMTLASSCQAAQEYLLMTMTENMLPTEALTKIYAGAKRPEELGTISFMAESREKDDVYVRFVRDNICLNIWANGRLAGEVLPLAQKIDAMIAKQPKLTHSLLIARRSSVMIGPKLEKQKTVSYEISAPAGQEIVSVQASIDGQSAVAKDGKIHLVGKKGRVRAKLTVITSELLAKSFERDLIIDK